jgi:hypothetical protein
VLSKPTVDTKVLTPVGSSLVTINGKSVFRTLLGITACKCTNPGIPHQSVLHTEAVTTCDEADHLCCIESLPLERLSVRCQLLLWLRHSFRPSLSHIDLAPSEWNGGSSAASDGADGAHGEDVGH